METGPRVLEEGRAHPIGVENIWLKELDSQLASIEDTGGELEQQIRTVGTQKEEVTLKFYYSEPEDDFEQSVTFPCVNEGSDILERESRVSLGNEKANSVESEIVHFSSSQSGEDAAFEKSVTGSENSLVASDREKFMVACDREKSVTGSELDKSVVVSDREKSLAASDREKLAVVSDREKSEVASDQEKTVDASEREKSVISSDHEKSVVASDREKSVTFSDRSQDDENTFPNVTSTEHVGEPAGLSTFLSNVSSDNASVEEVVLNMEETVETDTKSSEIVMKHEDSFHSLPHVSSNEEKEPTVPMDQHEEDAKHEKEQSPEREVEEHSQSPSSALLVPPPVPEILSLKETDHSPEPATISPVEEMHGTVTNLPRPPERYEESAPAFCKEPPPVVYSDDQSEKKVEAAIERDWSKVFPAAPGPNERRGDFPTPQQLQLELDMLTDQAENSESMNETVDKVNQE